MTTSMASEFAPANSNLKNMIADLMLVYNECNERRLLEFARWSSEFAYYLLKSRPLEFPEQLPCLHSSLTFPQDELSVKETFCLRLVQCAFDCREFERARNLSHEYRDSCHPILRFLHHYATYMAGEKKRLDNVADFTDKCRMVTNERLSMLRCELLKMYDSAVDMDVYHMYLYGKVLKELHLLSEAEKVFLEAVWKCPRCWPAWLELSKVSQSKEKFDSLSLPDHWMKSLCKAEAYIRFQFHTEALQIYENAEVPEINNTPYVMSQTALIHHNLQDLVSVVKVFQALRAQDPFRLDRMDTYSNCLFVKGMKTELASLAHDCFDVDKYCPETCCVVGNYYSARGEHEKAITYFERALKLNPENAGAWTLMGHEFMELKNVPAATHSYRWALTVDPQDFRAWYGLGQMYDILKMPNYATYYYKMAHKARPQDSRMIMALGDVFERQNKYAEACKCFWKAHCVGDIEGAALLRLGRVYEITKDMEQAASAYLMYLKRLEQHGLVDLEHQPVCYRFLAEFFIKENQLDEAQKYAMLSLEYDTTSAMIEVHVSNAFGKEDETYTTCSIDKQISKGGGAGKRTSVLKDPAPDSDYLLPRLKLCHDFGKVRNVSTEHASANHNDNWSPKLSDKFSWDYCCVMLS